MLNKSHQYLILSSDQRLWKFDQPVIFLGEWCCQYRQKETRSRMNFSVFKPYGISSNEKDLDHIDVKKLEQLLFPQFCNILNSYHNSEYDVKFWKIVLGHWFRRYINVVFNRVKTLQKCLESNNIIGVSLFESSSYSLSTSDSLDALWSFSNDRWNVELFSRIFEIIEPSETSVETVTDRSGIRCFKNTKEKEKATSFFKRVLNYINGLACFFSVKDQIFIINSFLPPYEEMKLHFKLGQIPKIRKNIRYLVNQNIDYSLRKSLSQNLKRDNTRNKIEEVLRNLLFESIPVCYLEGFNELLIASKSKKWPTNPKVIFTSNNFDTDEVFKLWTAYKVRNGSKYVVGQHGNSYGAARYIHPKNEVTTADRFITWGWNDNESNTLPGFIFKTVGKIAKEKYYGELLLVLSNYPHQISTWDEGFRYMLHFENQKKMINNLSIKVRQNLTVRLHSASSRIGWGEMERLKDFDSKIKISKDDISIDTALQNSRLVVYGYNSTGMLETLSLNIPTLAWWDGEFDHLTDDAKPYYKLLADVGIIHFTEESIANKINLIWDDIDSWWNDIELQDARSKFCMQYAKTRTDPITQMASLLSLST